MGDFSPWIGMQQGPSDNSAPQAPEPSQKGTKRDYANMLNERLNKKPRKMSAHFELPKKMKLQF